MELTGLILWLAMLLVGDLAVEAQEIVHHTRLGRISGRRETVMGKDIEIYLGIPFAQPPVGELRFRRPEAFGTWEDVWDGTNLPNSCPQAIDMSFGGFEGVTMWNANTNISEDCLYLNIWTPSSRREDRGVRPVMIWIYGGGFYAGTSTLELYDGRILAAQGDVTVVSMQYRTGAPGFLYLDTLGAPGNMGLLDQQMALQWIFNNIGDYGGDHQMMTIFGESSGAVSTSFHLLSEMSRHLFKHAIMQSAAALNPWGIDSPKLAKNKSLTLAKGVGCDFESVDDTLSCLRKVPHEDLTTMLWTLPDKMSMLLTPLVPTIDNYFLTQYPLDYLADGNLEMGSILLGVMHDEGAYFLPFDMPNLYNITYNSIDTAEKYIQGVRSLLHIKDELIAQLVAFEYEEPYHYLNRLPYADMLDDIGGDYSFICPLLDFALSSAEAGEDVYLYRYTHISSGSPWPRWMGALHGYEIDVIFGLPLNDSRGYTAEEKEFSKRVIELWTNFAKTGNPVQREDGSQMENPWPTYTVEDRRYLVLNATPPSELPGKPPGVQTGFRDRKCAFWRELLPRIRNIQEKDHNPGDQTCGSCVLGSQFTILSLTVAALLLYSTLIDDIIS